MLIGLLGGECTGKSALALALASAHGAVVVPEALRAFVEEHGRAPRALEQAAIMGEQERRTAVAVQQAGPAGIVVVDPSAAMTAVYSAIYFADDSLDDRAIADLDRCDLIAWCQPDIPWEPDGLMRDGEAQRAAAHAVVAGLLPRTRTPVVRAEGPLAQRVASVSEAMARIGS